MSAASAPSGPDPLGWTAVPTSDRVGVDIAVRRLLASGRRGTDLDVVLDGTSGRTALCMVATGGSPASLAALLEAGADPNARDAHGWTPLHDAACRGRTGHVATLLGLGVPVDATGNISETPLHVAAWSCRRRACARLLDAGAGIGNPGDTAFAEGHARNMVLTMRAVRHPRARLVAWAWATARPTPVTVPGRMPPVAAADPSWLAAQAAASPTAPWAMRLLASCGSGMR